MGSSRWRYSDRIDKKERERFASMTTQEYLAESSRLAAAKRRAAARNSEAFDMILSEGKRAALRMRNSR